MDTRVIPGAYSAGARPEACFLFSDVNGNSSNRNSSAGGGRGYSAPAGGGLGPPLMTKAVRPFAGFKEGGFFCGHSPSPPGFGFGTSCPRPPPTPQLPQPRAPAL